MIPVRRLDAPTRAALLSRGGSIEGAVRESVDRILEDFRKDPDGTLRDLTRKYDGADLERLEASAKEFAAAERNLPQNVQVAIRSMVESVTRYHKHDLLKGFEIQPVKGVVLGKMVVPFERAGLYVPGGRAAYPSSVVMAAVPAKVAGVKHSVLCTPPTSAGAIPEAVLFAAKACGVERVFKVGGAQAIFAMAYGTPTIPACDIVVGPGNAYVTAAKKRVQDDVAIDFLAGPSEVLVLSDGDASARFIAAELAAQAEHAPDTCALFVTPSASQAEAVAKELETQIASSDRAEIIRKSFAGDSAILVANTMEDAIAFSNEFGPEHLSICTKRPAEILQKIRSAGSVFMGEYTPVAVGDYGAGPNAILPTFGEARRKSGLTANTFLKTISYQMLNREGLEKVAPPATTLARIEGLTAHLRSIEVRLER